MQWKLGILQSKDTGSQSVKGIARNKLGQRACMKLIGENADWHEGYMHENAKVYFRASRADLIAIDGSALGTQTVAGIALTITRGLCISKEHPCSGHKEHWVRDVSCQVGATLVRVNIEKLKGHTVST
jgi:hypothetical protein